MITKSELKYFNSLLQKKFRKLESKFLAESEKSVQEGLHSDYVCELVFATNKFLEENKAMQQTISNKGTRLAVINSQDFRKISSTKSPQGIAAVFNKKSFELDESGVYDEQLIVYLDDVSDPGNLGTIIRNCDWFGVENIFLSKKSAEIFNPKVVRASMGSIFHINVFEDVDIKDIGYLKDSGYKFFCADTEGENIFETVMKDKIILSLSNESKGPSNALLSLIDSKVTIPGKGKAESLNVASASAILLAELTK